MIPLLSMALTLPFFQSMLYSLIINRASGWLLFLDSNMSVSMVAKMGAPLYLNLREPFIEEVVSPHLWVQVNAQPK